MSGDWYPGRLTQAEATFQDKDGPIGMQLGRAWQSAQTQPVHPIAIKNTIRLARSWAEVGVSTADCLEQSTLPRATSRPRRNRCNLLPLERLTPRSVKVTGTRS